MPEEVEFPNWFVEHAGSGPTPNDTATMKVSWLPENSTFFRSCTRT
ncbi:hypothetical protein [Amycolatopsis sp. QT-25]